MESKKKKIDEGYVRLLQIEISKRFPGEAKSNLPELLGISNGSYHNLFNQLEGTRTVDNLAKTLGLIPYDEFLNILPRITKVKDRLLSNGGVWVSYCFSSRRRPYESIWHFEEKSRQLGENASDAITKEHQFIEVTRETIDYTYTGELVINPDLSITIAVQTNPHFRIEYFTIFPDLKPDEFYETFNYVELEAIAIRKKEVFTTLEVLSKVPADFSGNPKRIENSRIPINIEGNDSPIPTNNAYLIYNYLTRNVSKARRAIDNFSINQKQANGSFLDYKHNIFISCPISYIESEDQFINLRAAVGEIIDILTDDYYDFDENSVFCEIAKYEHYKDIRRDDRHLYFETRQYLRATHFISIVPSDLAGNSSSIYMEIYFRILKKLPAIIFIENRLNLPSLLRGVMESTDRPVNVTFKDYQVQGIASYIKEAKDYLLEFSL